ncbi:hypothetical protein MCEMKE157_01196 [actinobacterium SCGC AAA044-D11]
MKITESFYENSRKAAVWLLRIESLILVGIVLYLLLASVFSTATWPSALIGEIVFALLGAAGLFFASMGFARRRSYGRAPAVLANAIAVGVSYYMITGGLLIVGIPLALLGAITFVAALFGYRE